MSGPVKMGVVVPGLPQPLLAPEANEGWGRIRAAFDRAREKIAAAKPDVLVIYSTMWPSIVGHQIQADAAPKWVHVDELFHDLGSIPYEFSIDAEFAHEWNARAKARGLTSRTVAYHGFPIDTGSVVALKLLTPDNDIPACIVSSNVYADRAESIVLGKAARDALAAQGKTAAAVAVMTLSNRLFTEFIDPSEDRIHSDKDDEWNRKILEFLGDGRLEDVAQLSREIQRQIRVQKVVNFKPMWWMSAFMGQHNRYDGDVLAYEALHGAGGAVVTLEPSAAGVGEKEFDEEDVEIFTGDRAVLTGPANVPTGADAPVEAPAPATPDVVSTDAAPKPVGAYPHARRVGDLLFLSGIGPRHPETNEVTGGAIRDGDGNPLEYDAAAQTRQVIENVRTILAASGATIDDVLDVTVFLTDMDRDFEAMNEVYRETFAPVQATRTTVAIDALPTPIAVEFKVIAAAPGS